MKSVDLFLTVANVAVLAAISPPAISYYYADTGPIVVSSSYSPELASN